MIWEEYRDQACRDQVSKVIAHLELDLARDVKGKRGAFYRYIRSKRQTGQNVGQLLIRAGNLVTEDTEKFSLLSALFSLVS